MRRMCAGYRRVGLCCVAALGALTIANCKGSSPRVVDNGEVAAGAGGRDRGGGGAATAVDDDDDNDNDNARGASGAPSENSEGGATPFAPNPDNEAAGTSSEPDDPGGGGATSEPNPAQGGSAEKPHGTGGSPSASEGGASDGTAGRRPDPATGGSGGGHEPVGPLLVCGSDNDCRDAGLLCDSARHLCVSCVLGTDCADDEQCVDGACEPTCVNSLDCAAGTVCDRDARRCVRCVTAEDCAGTLLCGGNRCWDPCSSDNACTPNGLLCDTSAGHCVECLYDVDCGKQARCLEGVCQALTCSPLESSCSGDRILTCDSTGNGYLAPLDCGDAGCIETEGTALCGLEGAGGAGSGGDCLTSGGDVCTLMPRFTGTQVVDGIGNEFCNVPPITLEIASAPYVNPNYNDALPTVAMLRAAWSQEAFHAHVSVRDAAVCPDQYYEELWYGDNVQFFIAGTGTLTGEYLGSSDGGATHIIIAPPASAGDTAEAIQLFESSLGTVYTDELASTEYAARLVPDGYEVEIRSPWSEYADAMTSGGRMGFDFIVGASDSSS
ncbi:MAG: hypothetical protein JW940_30210, partial [Polyangiaceae bacterium]|nr:hypothetical protein [Polyangiaceae bacterium]